MNVTLALSDEQLDAIAERAAAIVLNRLADHDNGSPWLSLREAAEYLGVSERTIERRIAGRRIRSTTLGRRRLLHRDNLDALVSSTAGEETTPVVPPRRRKA